MIELPPGKYFISHSYKDEVVRQEMMELLPDGVEPFIFPQIKVSPLEFVSSTLIGAILACDGMIYLDGGYSAKSFWVAFERDYALRSSKKVFRYDPRTRSLTSLDATALQLFFFPTYLLGDENRVKQILDFMHQSRHFESFLKNDDDLGGDYHLIVKSQTEKAINNGGYMVVFWTEMAERHTRLRRNIPIEAEIKSLLHKEQSNRIIFAVLDDVPLMYDFENHPLELRVDLFEHDGLSSVNRIDDLIIRLYWLIFRNQFPELVYE